MGWPGWNVREERRMLGAVNTVLGYHRGAVMVGLLQEWSAMEVTLSYLTYTFIGQVLLCGAPESVSYSHLTLTTNREV